MRVVMRIAGQRLQVRRLHVPRDARWWTGNAGRRVVYRRHWRHVAGHRRRAGRRAVADVLAHTAGATVTAAAAAATATAADVSSGWARLTAGRRTVTCEVEKKTNGQARPKHNVYITIILLRNELPVIYHYNYYIITVHIIPIYVIIIYSTIFFVKCRDQVEFWDGGMVNRLTFNEQIRTAPT